MNAIGIDVSKGKSTVAVIRPFGEIVRKPFDVAHSSKGLAELVDLIHALEGESRVVRSIQASIQNRSPRLCAMPGSLSAWSTPIWFTIMAGIAFVV